MSGVPAVPFHPLRNYVFGPAQADFATGQGNVGMGEVALYSLREGALNTAVGDQPMWQHQRGDGNVAVGSLALVGSVESADCTAAGTGALQQASAAVACVGVGRYALASSSAPSRATAVGDSALRMSEAAVDSVACGFRVAESVQSVHRSVVIGSLAAVDCRVLQDQVSVGFFAMGNAGTEPRADCTAVGAQALAYAQGDRNVGIGAYAGHAVQQGQGNIFVGVEAGALGEQHARLSQSIAIGDSVQTGERPQVAIGGSGTASVKLGGVEFLRHQLMALLALVRPTQTRQSIELPQGQRIVSGSVRPLATLPDLTRRRCVSTLFAAPMAGVLSACGGGDPPDRSTMLDRGERARAQALSATAASQQLPLEGSPPLGNPQVPANPLRNYVFGPTQIQFAGDSAMANVGVGEGVLRSITTGWANTAIGDNALVNQQSGINCVGVGAGALVSAVAAIDCTAIGANALHSAVDGVGATAVGRLAAASVPSGSNHTAVGAYSMRLATGGVANVAIGYSALEHAANANESVFVGAHSGRHLPGGDRNVAVGWSALGAASIATSDNVAIGESALLQAHGGRNVAIGAKAGERLTGGTRNVFIGCGAGASAFQNPNASNCVVIGDGAYTRGSNEVVIGNSQTEVVVLGGVSFTREQLIRLASISRRTPDGE